MTRFGVASLVFVLNWTAAMADPAQDQAAPAGNAAVDGTPPAAPAEARIPFANRQGIYSWHVVDDKTVLIQAQNRQWYKATLMTPCFDLPFAETIGFESNADGSFDKFSAIKLRRQKCQLISLVKSDPPPKKAKKSAAPTPSPAPAAASTPANP
jgi:hypothetical protein